MELHDLDALKQRLDATGRMPVLFVGHGSPMNAIEDNPFSQTWRTLGAALPRPQAILCVSAHWESRGTLVTAMEQPRTIHDFGGFPPELYEAEYPAKGSPWLAQEVSAALGPGAAGLDGSWGLDHGAWSVLLQMFPAADVPVVQLSLDYGKSEQAQYEVGRALAPLRRKGVLILGSGNMVHNLRRISLPGGWPDSINTPFGFDWALEASSTFKRLIDERNHRPLIDYPTLGTAVRLAVPTREHYLPMLYALALQEPDEEVSYFTDVAVAGSLTMTSFVIN